MRNSCYITSVLLMLIAWPPDSALAQKQGEVVNKKPEFGPPISSATLTIGSDQHQGYAAQFDFPPKNLEQGWWRYLKKVARVKNRKTYWRLSFPPEKGESNVPVEMFSEIRETGSRTTLTLALNAINMDASTRKDYLTQTKNFLVEFKAKFYRDYIQELLIRAEKRERQLSKDHQKAISIRNRMQSKLATAQAKGGEDNSKVAALSSDISKLNTIAEQKAAAVAEVEAEIEFLKKTLLGYVQQSGS